MSNFDNVLLYYHHPHIQTFVQNNTIRTEDLADPVNTIDSAQVVLASEGIDNVFQYFKSLPAYIEEHGSPNYALYGQAAYNVTEALRSNQAGVHVMRVMPQNATHANVVILAKYKVIQEEDPATEVDSYSGKRGTIEKLELKFESMVIESATTVEELQLKFSELDKEEADEQGYNVTPVVCLYVRGRGEYGNLFRGRIVDATSYEDPENIYKTYRVDVMKMEKSLIIKEHLYGTLDPSSFDAVNKESLYLEDIINDPETGSGKVNVMIHEYGVEKILAAYNAVTGVTPLKLNEFDPLLGIDLSGKALPHLTIVQGDTKLALNSIDGFALNGGTEGDFAINKDNATKREQKIEELMVKAYNGELDKSITSRFSTPVAYMLDANYSDDVKRALVQLNIKRGYNMAYVDTGLLATVNDTINWGETYKNVCGDNIVKEMHHYKVRDTDYTGKTIPMTTTHYLAFNLPQHIMTKGLGEPFAMTNAVIRNVVKGSFKPIIDPNDHDVKKELYALRLNCYETVKANVFQRTTAITSNLQISDLLDEFNVYILNRAVEICEGILREKLYKLGEPEDRAAYQKDADRKLQFELGKLVRTANVEFKMSPRDEAQNILRLALRIKFKTIIKRGIVEIYIDPRANA